MLLLLLCMEANGDGAGVGVIINNEVSEGGGVECN